LLTLI